MATKNVQTLVDDIAYLGHEQHWVVEYVRKLVKTIVSPVSEKGPKLTMRSDILKVLEKAEDI
ncbi:hypothetical protein [Marinobacter sp.]|uniref:hypothetical protein n=1 Tax=Marinobacter sp. TaxID=50741 RepID=UPI002B26DFAB|nr:hypothetical protein [Marinobacter sp.]